MTVDLRHLFVSPVASTGSNRLVQGPNWNEGHNLQQGPQALLGRSDAAAGQAATTEVLLDPASMTFVGGKLAAISSSAPAQPQQYGAIGDGVADDGAALTSWLAALSPTKAGYLPAGTYNTSVPLVKTGSNISITGAGGRVSTIKYVGASTTADIFTIGDGVSQIAGWTLRGFRVSSNTTMTDGTGIRLRKFCRSDMSDIVADGQDGTGNLWNGFWFNQVDCVVLRGYYARGQNDALRVDGGVGVNPKADLHLLQGKIAYGAVGLHMGGGFGGLLIDETDLGANGINLLIDTTLAAERNRELMAGPTAVFDTCTTANIRFSDTLALSFSYFNFVGSWIGSCQSTNVVIDSGFAGTIRFEGCRIYNGGSDGILNNSTTAIIDIDNCELRNNTGYGVNSTVINSTMRVQYPRFFGNVAGTYNATFVKNIVQFGFDTAYVLSTPRLSIGGGGGVDRAMTVQSPATGGASIYGIRNVQQIQSDVVTLYTANNTAMTTVNSLTLAQLRHYEAAQGVFGAGTTITAQYGFIVGSSLTGATSNYAYYGGIGAATGNWNAYMTGTANNAFAGNTRFGSTVAPTSTVDITGTLTTTGLVTTPVSTTTNAGLRIPHGAAPTAPVNGDIWTTTAGLFVRINGATIGPLT